MTEALKSADIGLIQRIIPHRYPFLLVDRVIDIEGTKRGVGIKNVTMNEPFLFAIGPSRVNLDDKMPIPPAPANRRLLSP